jgi:DNA-binding MarR family transcriptional regulator
MKKVLPNVAGSLMMASRAHMAAVTARLALRGYDDFPFASASLLWLMDEGGTRSTVLAQRAGVTKQAMSQLVRQMEGQGYLEQAPDPTDTRAKVVRMTRRGEAVKTACVEVREELNRKVTRTLGADEAALLEANLDAAAGLFSEITGTSSR